MILIGHPFLKSNPLYHIADIDSIQNTPSSSILYFSFSKDRVSLAEHCRLNDIDFALHATTIREIIYSHAIEAKYIIISKELAEVAQKIANDYLFDSKILVQIEDEEDIDELANIGVDGVIFTSGIVKVNS